MLPLLPQRAASHLLRDFSPLSRYLHRVACVSKHSLDGFPLSWLSPNQPARSFSRFSHGSGNMATISQVKGDESGKAYRRLIISSACVSTTPQGRKHPVITQSMKNIKTDNSNEIKIIETDNPKETKSIERSGRISEFIDEDKRSDKDPCRPATDLVYSRSDTWGQSVNLTDCKEYRLRTTKDQMGKVIVSQDKAVSADQRYHPSIVVAGSKHRDNSIYKSMDIWWKKEYNIANRNETRLEAMMLSDPTGCSIHDGLCTEHCAGRMLQIFSLELAEICGDGGLVELYGYLAVRDSLDPLLNYVVNISRDNPISVNQGSLINMVGPKRGIELLAPILIEYDMKIKTNKHEKNDLQLIDGVSIISNFGSSDKPYKIRIPGDCGAIDITFARIGTAVEATVQIFISEVQSSFNLSLNCLTSGLGKKISLFDGAISESCGLKRFVIAVKRNSLIDLKFEMGTQSSTSDQHRCFFKAKVHGHDIQNLKTCFALISVKVTWSTLPDYFPIKPRY